MRSWIKRLLLLLSLLLCQSCAYLIVGGLGLFRDYAITSFWVRNMTEEVVIIDWVHEINGESGKLPTKTYRLPPGDTIRVVYCENGTEGDFLSIQDIGNCKLSLSTEDGALLRYWAKYDDPDDLEEALEGCHASYFKDSVRQLHDEKEWTITKEEKEWVYLFDILPEDLVPLHEIAGEKEQ